MASKKSKLSSLTVRLSENAGVKKSDNLHAYVVNAQGKVVASIPFDGREASISDKHLPPDGSEKIYLAPGLPSGLTLTDLTERDLLKASAYRPTASFTDKRLIDVAHIPASALRPLYLNWCLIKGHIHKSFFIDGEWKDLSLCNMRVHVCEVETEFLLPHLPIYYRRIPDWVIVEVAEKIKGLQQQVNPLPVPVPNPIGPVSMQKFNLPLRSLGMNKSVETRSGKMPAVSALPDHVSKAISTTSVNDLRAAFSQHHQILYPYFCLWPIYWPWFYFLEEDPDDIVYTDCDGNFELWENLLFEDGPLNIYIWVEACINNIWQTVYRPPIPCNTWWNYHCNTNIDINITDSRVMPCTCDDQLQGEIVWFKSVGWGATALHVEQVDANTVTVANGTHTATMLNVGCTDIIDSHRISPFGGMLGLRILFGDGLPAGNITHYRWTQTKIKDANLTSILSPVTSVIGGQINKGYYVITNVGGVYHFETHSAVLGAEGSGDNIGYRIPQWDVYSDPGVAAADKVFTLQWTSPDFFGAWIDSNSLSDGLYRFDLELLSKDASGVFHVVPVPRTVFQVSEYSNSGNSEPAPDAYINLAGSNARNLTIKLRVDNAPCHADIHDVELVDAAGNPVIDAVTGLPVKSGKCGFIKYTDISQKARISFEATQPRNFATFGFGVVKGNGSESTGVAADRYVVTSAADFTLIAGVYTQNVPITQLLGSCPGQAAFAENLNVYALATDGSNRLQYGYDAGDTNAFALSN